MGAGTGGLGRWGDWGRVLVDGNRGRRLDEAGVQVELMVVQLDLNVDRSTVHALHLAYGCI